MGAGVGQVTVGVIRPPDVTDSEVDPKTDVVPKRLVGTALMVVVPAALAVASPCLPILLLMVTIDVIVEDQNDKFVKLSVMPFGKFPVAANCCVAPT